MIKLNKQLLLRFVCAWAASAGVFFCAGEILLAPLLPLLQWIANGLSTDYLAQLSLASTEQGSIIKIMARVSHNLFQYSIPVAPQGAELSGAGTLMHALTPLVILFALVVAWPGPGWQVFTRLLLGVPLGVFIMCGTVPVLLVSHIESTLYNAVQNVATEALPMPAILYWVMFMEMGGLWLFSILAALIVITLAQWLHIKRFA